MTLEEFLKWLITSSGASAVMSFLLERFPPFQKLSSQVKAWVTYGGTLVLALGAYAIIIYVPAETLAALAPWFTILAGVTIPFVASQIAHKSDPKTENKVVVTDAEPVKEGSNA